MMMLACQCEHRAHFEKDARTPYGNPGHKYGVQYARGYTQVVKTPWSSFTVCRDCADDCLDAYSS